MSNGFQRCSIPMGDDGQTRSGYMVTCDACKKVGTIVAANGSKSLPHEAIRKKFTQKGWRLTSKVCRCPDCQPARSVSPKEAPLPTPEPATAPVAEAPRAMTPADKRSIFRALDDAWDEPKGRYSGSNTDQSVADALGLPRAWVSTVRVEAFGESQRNEDHDKLLGNARNLAAESRRRAAEALELAQKYETLAGQYAELAETVSKIA